MIEGLFQPMHLIIILVIVLIVFGAGKLADVGGALGKSVKEFKESTSDLKDGPSKEPIQSASTATAPQASPGTDTTDQPEHWHDTGKLPARPGQKPPRDIGLTRVTVPEARRLLAASVRQTFRNTWSIWRRRHQARARWHHYQAQLQAAPP